MIKFYKKHKFIRIYKKNTLIINVQGDQPFLDPKLLKKMIDFCFKNNEIPLLTTPIYKLNKNDIHNPNVVKTLLNNQKQTLTDRNESNQHDHRYDCLL